MRSGILGALLAAASGVALAHAADESSSVSPTYAESAALVGMSPGGEIELSLRLARFPGRGEGTFWLAVFVDDQRYGVALDDVSLGSFTGRTPVEEPVVSFAIEGPARARLECKDRDTEAMRCTAHAEALTHETYHPPLGAGTVPVSVDAEFVARHRGAPTRSGRLEVFGTVVATVSTPQGSRRIEAPGKWHEQTGERPRFGGPFTYFSIQGGRASLLARTGGGSTWGFAVLDRQPIEVKTFTIDPIGPPRRKFRVELADGRVIEGEAKVLRETSVPIEGQRRPSATVTVSTNLGDMVGHLNDWKPEP